MGDLDIGFFPLLEGFYVFGNDLSGWVTACYETLWNQASSLLCCTGAMRSFARNIESQ